MAEEVKFQKVDGKSLDIEAVDKEKLKKIFPQCFNEGTLDINKLLSLCGEYIDNDYEKYKFEWKGKSECYRIAGKRSTGTLRPCPEESVDFENTNNLYIEGDNLEVLKLLQTAYYRKVKMIYIDPPYNTGNDFVYEDDFKDPLAKYKEITSQTTKSNPETMGRYHTNWLNMMYPRLRLAANLLRDDGVIFISIDDNEVHNLRKLCDEVFGEENFIGIIIQSKQNAKNDTLNIQKNHEYIIAYRKSILLSENGTKILATIADSYKSIKDIYEENGKYFYINDTITTRGDGGTLSARPNLGYTVYYNPKTKDKVAVCDYDISKAKIAKDYSEIYKDDLNLVKKGYIPIRPPKVRGQLGVWTWSLEKFNEEKESIIITGKQNSYAVKKRVFIDQSVVRNVNGKLQYCNCSLSNVRSVWNYSTNDGTMTLNEIMSNTNTFSNAKNLDMIKKLIDIVPLFEKDIILDFFSGSATTAHAVMQLNAEDGGNRQFIMVQLPELTAENSEAFKAGYKNICEIGKERIRRAGAKIKEEYLKNHLALTGHSSTGEEQFPSQGGVAAQADGVVKSRNTQNYLSLPYNAELTERAKELRKAGNLSEVLLWNQIKNKQFKGLDFDRQKIIGNYIVDFYCASLGVVIEIDGYSHENKVDYDSIREDYLKSLGLTVIHILDSDVKKNIEEVMMMLKNHVSLTTPPNGTPPQEGNGIGTGAPEGRENIPDFGFKVLKLDTSNLVKWDDTPTDSEEDLFQRMDSVVKSLKNDRSELDVVFEVMLKLGIPPTYKVNEINVNGRKVYSIGDDGLVLICLDSANGGITPEDISAMCDLAPAKIVAAEEAFEDDIALSNAYYISKDKGIEIELL